MHYNYRRRRRTRRQRTIRLVRLVAIGLVGLWLIVKIIGWIAGLFGAGNHIRESAVQLKIDRGDAVSISLNNEDERTAEGEMKIYEEDAVRTHQRSKASLILFDESRIRLDNNTKVRVLTTKQGTENSRLALRLQNGNMWITTPTVAAFSGSIVRVIETPFMRVMLPSQAEAALSPRSLTLFSGDGIGASIEVENSEQPVIYIGEGQHFALPDGDAGEDLYAYRRPLDPQLVQSTFVTESRTHFSGETTALVEPPKPELPAISPPLVVRQPPEGLLTDKATVRISGDMRTDVTTVRINGYSAALDPIDHTFTLDLALPDEDLVTVQIEAIDDNDTILETVRRTIERDRKPPESPTIISPVGSGGTFLVNGDSIEIVGETRSDIAGIIVNDYRLQFYNRDNDNWVYIASNKMGNLKPGLNTIVVEAINDAGVKSAPTTLTIIQGEGEEGVVTESTEEPSDSPRANLPTNEAILPGTISIKSPSIGTGYTAIQKEFFIEGTVPNTTHSVWVNGYQLKLYNPGASFWSYKASTELNTLRRGKNVYTITARDSDGQILDEFDYTVTFKPGRRR